MTFMLLVVLLFQSMAVLVVTRQVAECWGRFERSRAFGEEESSMESLFVKAGYLDRVHNPDAPRKTDLHFLKPFTYGDSLLERLRLRQDRLHKLVMFRAIRHEFLYPRKENRRGTPRVRDPALFSFEAYLRERLGVAVLALVEINIGTWVATLLLLVPVLYFTLQLNSLYVQAVQCTLAWLLAAVAAVLTIMLEEDTYKFTPEVPQDSRDALRLFDGTSTQMLRRASQVTRYGSDTGRKIAQSTRGRRFRPGLGDLTQKAKPKLSVPPFFQENADKRLFLSSQAYEQALRFIGFLQAISVTALVLSSLSNTQQSPAEVVLYLLTWLEWPVMLFKVVPTLLRRLTVRNSIEGKKCTKAIRTSAEKSSRGLLRDFLLLVRVAGVGRRSAEGLLSKLGPDEMQRAVEGFETLDQTEQCEIWSLFAVWDAGNTGQVDIQEVEATFAVLGFSPERARLYSRGLLQLVDDDDGSGKLTWRKLQATTMVAMQSPLEKVAEDLETFYELIDENADGMVTVFELTRGLRRMRIGIKADEMANLLYRNFGTARLKVSKADFMSWAATVREEMHPEPEKSEKRKDFVAA
mmetsp:Transcript_88521/g.264027  ORF Transcript_88521/g.264027 Transcript_88521/m.264027 type:complete len:578 (-) Transcript_88521:93-1826(-)